jgi:hypothetical protein
MSMLGEIGLGVAMIALPQSRLPLLGLTAAVKGVKAICGVCSTNSQMSVFGAFVLLQC